MKKLECPSCMFIFEAYVYLRNCSNCFVCRGCEKYRCPKCKNEIVVKGIPS